MAEIDRVQRIIAAPKVAHDPHRVHKSDDAHERKRRDHPHDGAPEDALVDAIELHEIDESGNPTLPLERESHIDPNDSGLDFSV